MMESGLLRIESEELHFTGGRKIRVEKGLHINRGLTVIRGGNGTGKTTFAKILENGRNFLTNRIEAPEGTYPKIKLLEFNDIHSIEGLSSGEAAVGYYQQRYEAGMNDEVPTVAEVVGEKIFSPEFQRLKREFMLGEVEEKKINHLSSGETRKLIIIQALTDSPDFLILDNPYIGLDRPSRKILDDTFVRFKAAGKSLMLLLTNQEEIPAFADNIIYANPSGISSEEEKLAVSLYQPFMFREKSLLIEGAPVCEMENCVVKYGSRSLLNSFSWVVRKGERWSLSGPNGSGKSTLLSLLNADNPKAYCNNIKMFGMKRGRGVSIWDIKKRIGYVSPEMRLHFHGGGTVADIIANGLNDTVGMYVKPTDAQKEQALKWISHFKLEKISHRTFSALSSGEKQMVLIARSMIKEPELLILDEPMHALDSENLERVRQTLRDFLTANRDCALIMVTHSPEDLPEEINRWITLPA
ncbi:MAG: ATP-binding cassette domain-containing protein [Muribaculaceae bacterium]|nr:ATP-binding cassette domain-containing protein [Muribaculaceae bacterium]